MIAYNITCPEMYYGGDPKNVPHTRIVNYILTQVMDRYMVSISHVENNTFRVVMDTKVGSMDANREMIEQEIIMTFI